MQPSHRNILLESLKEKGWNPTTTGLGEYFLSIQDPSIIAKFVVEMMLHGPFEELEAQGLDIALKNRDLDEAINGPMRNEIYTIIEVELQREFNDFVESKNTHKEDVDLLNDYTFIQHALNFLPLVNVKRHNLTAENGSSSPFEMNIPVYDTVQEKWLLIPYQLELINLNPGNSKINTVYSYGFTPKNQNNQENTVTFQLPSFLVHSGTTPPSMDGNLVQLFSDMLPVAEVGGTLWWTGKDNINEWLRQQTRVFMSGVSLGGSLSMMVARNCSNPEVLEKVTAINPGKLLFPDFGVQKNTPSDNQEWVVIRQDGDLLGRIGGYYPDSFEVINVGLNQENDALLNRTGGFPFNGTVRHSSCFFGYGGHIPKERYADNSQNFALAAILWMGVLIARTILFIVVVAMWLCQTLLGHSEKAQKENTVNVTLDQAEIIIDDLTPSSIPQPC